MSDEQFEDLVNWYIDRKYFPKSGESCGNRNS